MAPSSQGTFAPSPVPRSAPVAGGMVARKPPPAAPAGTPQGQTGHAPGGGASPQGPTITVPFAEPDS
jgi:hypothetical protein